MIRLLTWHGFFCMVLFLFNAVWDGEDHGRPGGSDAEDTTLMRPAARIARPKDQIEFSLVSGGALYRLWRRTRLSGDALEFTGRRVVVAILIMWVPLLLLSIAEGHAWGSGVALPFLQDVETHLRLLIAAPLLLLAEFRVHRQVSPIVQRFVANGLIAPAARPQFDAAIASALRLRNSVVAELLLIVFVYARRHPVRMARSGGARREQLVCHGGGWAAASVARRLVGGLVSMPIFQFLCLRWYFRFFIWARFLWQVSRMDLKLEPAHPDGAAGLQFSRVRGTARLLADPARVWTVLAGMMANRIFYAGARLLDFRVEIVGTVALLVFAVLGPLLVFPPQLRAARRKGLARLWQAGAALCARVRRQMDSRRRVGRRAAAGQRRHSVVGGSAQQLPGDRGHSDGAVRHEERARIWRWSRCFLLRLCC